MATTDVDDARDPYEEALARLSEAQTAIEKIDSEYAPVFAGMADELGNFLEADRDGELAQAAAMLDQLREAWESQDAGDEE